MKENLSVTKDDVARLTRGKPSKSRCGSRQIRHRLRLDELERLNVARSRGYLVVTPSTRTALKNSWYLDCVASSRSCIYAERTPSGYLLSGIKDEKPFTTEISQEQFTERFSMKQADRDLATREAASVSRDKR